MEKQVFTVHINGRDMGLSAKINHGRDDMLLFIHGLGCAKESFDDLWGFPEFMKYSIITFDLPGFGDSSKPEDFSYDMQDLADVCLQLPGIGSGGQVHIIGHSMGGAVGLLLAYRLGRRTESFMNVEGNLFRTDCKISRGAASAQDLEKFKERLFANLNFFSPLKNEKGPALWARWIEKSSPEAFNKSSASLVKWTDSGELLKKFMELECRKAYICGDKNAGRKILTYLTGIKKVSIPGSGHFPMNDNPKEFYKTLYGLLNRRDET